MAFYSDTKEATFIKAGTQTINKTPIEDGQIIFNKDNKTISVDGGGLREEYGVSNELKQQINDTVNGIVADREQIEQNKNDKLSKLNMCTSDIMAKGKPSGTSVTKDKDKITLTTTTNYGRYIIRLTEILDNFEFIVTFWAEKDSIYPFNVHPSIYCYDENSKPLGALNIANSDMMIKSEGKYIYKCHINGILNKYPLTKSIDIGLLCSKEKVKISFYTYNIISDAYDLVARDNFNDFFNEKGYLVDSLYYSTPYSVKSKMSDSSNFAKISQHSSFSETGFEELILTKNDLKEWYSTIDSVNGNEVVVSPKPNINYGGIGLLTKKFSVTENKRYVLVIKSNSTFANAGFINKSGVGFVTFPSNKILVNDVEYTYYDINTDDKEAEIDTIYLRTILQTTTVNFIALTEINKDMSSSDLINYLKYKIIGKTYNIGVSLKELYDLKSGWTNKNVLFIGDSLTAGNQYQNTVKDKLQINVFNHCKGGLGLVELIDGDKGLGGNYDNETNASGELKPLSVNDVANKDLIVFYGGYNDRHSTVGKVGDLYPSQDTIAGKMQYCINRIYSLLKEANNLNCKLLIVTVDCSGRYPWADANGYEEYPKLSGQNMETLANTQKTVAEANSLACLDLYHNSGINRNTWSIFGANSNPINEKYSPYRLNSNGEPESEERIRYVNGQSYYQKRNGQVVLEKYEGTAPYPYNGDQLHKSLEGYKRIGECIVGSIIKSYGN